MPFETPSSGKLAKCSDSEKLQDFFSKNLSRFFSTPLGPLYDADCTNLECQER